MPAFTEAQAKRRLRAVGWAHQVVAIPSGLLIALMEFLVLQVSGAWLSSIPFSSWSLRGVVFALVGTTWFLATAILWVIGWGLKRWKNWARWGCIVWAGCVAVRVWFGKDERSDLVGGVA